MTSLDLIRLVLWLLHANVHQNSRVQLLQGDLQYVVQDAVQAVGFEAKGAAVVLCQTRVVVGREKRG